MGAASFRHQGICMLVSERPQVLLELIGGSSTSVPGTVELWPGPETVREIRFPEHVADAVVVVRKTCEGELVEALVSEVQLQPDEAKRWSWPIHVAGTRARLGCPTTLVVITDDEATARWASQPIDLGRGCMVLQPLVIGPDRLPRDLDLETIRRHPELATLAVMMHGHEPGSKRLSKSTLTIVKEGLDNGDERYRLLMDLITGCLSEGTLHEIGVEMDTKLQHRDDDHYVPIGWYFRRHYDSGMADGMEKGRAAGLHEGREAGLREGREAGLHEGLHEGLRQAIALVLVSRGLPPSPAQLERMTRCTDDAQLQAWLRRACEVTAVDQLFEPRRAASARRAGRIARGAPASSAEAASVRRSR